MILLFHIIVIFALNKMEIRYDKEADAMYIKIKDGKYDISEELSDNIILDKDKSGKIIGIEILFE